jgi:hypothetical protein
MKAIREQIIDIIYGIATGTERIRLILTPLVGLIFFSIVLFLIFISFFSGWVLGISTICFHAFEHSNFRAFFDDRLFSMAVVGREIP